MRDITDSLCLGLIIIFCTLLILLGVLHINKNIHQLSEQQTEIETDVRVMRNYITSDDTTMVKEYRLIIIPRKEK